MIPSAAAVEKYGNDHGTHVAGITAGKTVDADGSVTFAGQSPEAQLAIFKVFSDSTYGASTDTILAALNDALLLDVDVINMSLGAHGGDLGEVLPEAQQDDGVLQHLFRCEADAVLHDAARLLLPPKGDDHADEEGDHRAALHGQRLAEKPAGKGDGRAQADAGGHVLHVRHDALLTSRDVNSDCRV